MPKRCVRGGFTLVELLVVIGIIMLLIALLMPALQRAKMQSQRIQCMSNLRQFGMIERLYANDNRGVILGRPVSSTPTPMKIWTRYEPFIKYFTKINFNDVVDTREAIQARSLLKCPTNPFTADGWTTTLAYEMMDWVKFDTISYPADVLIAGDTWANSGSTTYLLPEQLYASYTPPRFWLGHGNTASFLMADGHVQVRRQDEVPVVNDSRVVNGDKGAMRFPGYTRFWRSIPHFYP